MLLNKIHTGRCQKQKVDARFLSADKFCVKEFECKTCNTICNIKAAVNASPCTSTVCIHTTAPVQTHYLEENEADHRGWRQSGRLVVCRGLDMAHIKGGSEEAGSHRRKSNLRSLKWECLCHVGQLGLFRLAGLNLKNSQT